MRTTLSKILFLAAVALTAFGIFTMYHYDGSEDATKIVGGDAYNYIIISIRGAAWIAAGGVCAVIASALHGCGCTAIAAKSAV